MPATAHWFVQQELGRVGSHARQALAQVRRARTLREVHQTVQVPVPVAVRSLSHLVHELRDLELAAEQRMRELVADQLAAVAKLTDFKARERELGALRAQHWQYLRADFPLTLAFAEQEAAQLLRPQH